VGFGEWGLVAAAACGQSDVIGDGKRLGEGRGRGYLGGVSSPTETEGDALPASLEAEASRGGEGTVALPPIGWASNHAAGSVGGLGESLGLMLERELSPRLSKVRAFRTAWQRGGAFTAYGVWREREDEAGEAVVVKVPVPPCEVFWLTALQAAREGEGGVAPRVYAHGASVGGYDLAWVVMERLTHGPINGPWGETGIDLMLESLNEFHRASSARTEAATVGRPAERDWAAMIERSRKAVSAGGLPGLQRWNQALKKAKKKAARWQAAWDGRSLSGWCHGDFHGANVMSRSAPPGGPGVLIDFAQTRPGHWLEDAVYFEQQYWATPGGLAGRRPDKALAESRRQAGLMVEQGWQELATALRAWFAVAAPQTLGRRHGEAHLAAALGVLERLVAGRSG